MKSKTVTQHVVPHADGWAVRRSGAERVTETFSRQSDAINRGRDIARNQGVELVIHDKAGQINRRDSYGNDPFPPKG